MNLRVVNEYKSNNLALATSLHGCKISECKQFDEPLQNPAELPVFFTEEQVTSEILGISFFDMYACSQVCSKKLTEIEKLVVKCSSCNLIQKKPNCSTQCLVEVLVRAGNNTKLTLTLFNHALSVFSYQPLTAAAFWLVL